MSETTPEIPDYDRDLMVWYGHQIALLRQRSFTDLDLENLIEELDGHMRSMRRELARRLERVLTLLLKCQFQHERRKRRWLSALDGERSEIDMLLEESPSLRRCLDEVVERVYPWAVRRAALDTGLDRKAFPEINPYSLAQQLDENFIPSAGTPLNRRSS